MFSWKRTYCSFWVLVAPRYLQLEAGSNFIEKVAGFRGQRPYFPGPPVYLYDGLCGNPFFSLLFFFRGTNRKGSRVRGEGRAGNWFGSHCCVKDDTNGGYWYMTVFKMLYTILLPQSQLPRTLNEHNYVCGEGLAFDSSRETCVGNDMLLYNFTIDLGRRLVWFTEVLLCTAKS